MLYEDKRQYVCLAQYLLTEGHTVVVRKKCVQDLHLLKRDEYEHLMGVVDKVRNALLKVFHVRKVYLIYMDEANHVHRHLVPRYNEQGYNVLTHTPRSLNITPRLAALRKKLWGLPA